MIPIELKNISKTFTSGDETIQALDNISAIIPASSFTSIIGKSGSGKTTLLNIIAKLDSPSQGTVLFNNKDLQTYTSKEMDLLRNQSIGFIFQNFLLLSDFSVIENVMLPYFIKTKDKAKALEKASDLLEMIGLSHRKKLFPKQISAGEQQRVAICRAIINNPHLILADEPTGNLDEYNQNHIMESLMSLKAKLKFTLILVTHNQNIAKQADQELVMDFGKLFIQ